MCSKHAFYTFKVLGGGGGGGGRRRAGICVKFYVTLDFEYLLGASSKGFIFLLECVSVSNIYFTWYVYPSEKWTLMHRWIKLQDYRSSAKVAVVYNSLIHEYLTIEGSFVQCSSARTVRMQKHDDQGYV